MQFIGRAGTAIEQLKTPLPFTRRESGTGYQRYVLIIEYLLGCDETDLKAPLLVGDIACLDDICRPMIPISDEKKPFVVVCVLVNFRYTVRVGLVDDKTTKETIGSLQRRMRVIPSLYQFEVPKQQAISHQKVPAWLSSIWNS